MCERCVRKLKHMGFPKGQYGKIKALAQRFSTKFHLRPTKRGGVYAEGCVGLFRDMRMNVGVEAHLHKILRAKTNKNRYSRKNYRITV